MARIQNCGVCNSEDLAELIDFGTQSICHHFLKSSKEEDLRHDLAMGQCKACGTVQLTDRIPVNELRPRYDWLTCTEPEDHLDRLVTTMSRLPGITPDSRIHGLSFKDDSTLDRFNKLGFKNTWRADPRTELGITDPNANIESIQDSFNSRSADRLIKNHGKADIFIARHIMEHSYDVRQFIELSKRLVAPQGYIVLEIPDCQRAFEEYDYTTIWEQHTTYFTGETFRNCFDWNGLSLVYFERMPYSIEDSYVGIAKVAETRKTPVLKEDALRLEISRAEKFAGEYPTTKNKIKRFFADYRQNQGKVALFGGGHMSCTFVNLFELKDLIEFVVDDNPNMRGLFMPGSRLPIFESGRMYDQAIKLCILTLSATSEEKVVKKNQRFLESGGRFLSVFPGSKWAIKV